MTKTYYTYLHRRADDGAVFYIGCATKQVRRRGKDSYQRAYDFGQRSLAWFEIKAAHGVTVEIDNEFNDKGAAFNREKELIAAHSGLVNIATGGPGAPGIKDNDEVRMKKSVTKIGELNPMYGKTGARHPMARPVVHIHTGIFFDSIQDAAENFGYKMKTLHNFLSGHRKNNTGLEFA